MKLFDIPALIIATLLVIGSWWMGIAPEGLPALVRVHAADGSVIELPLNRPQRIEVQGPLGRTVIEVADGGARMLDSPCTAKLCIRAGWLEDSGAIAACLPNQVLLEIAGEARRYDSIIF